MRSHFEDERSHAESRKHDSPKYKRGEDAYDVRHYGEEDVWGDFLEAVHNRQRQQNREYGAEEKSENSHQRHKSHNHKDTSCFEKALACISAGLKPRDSNQYGGDNVYNRDDRENISNSTQYLQGVSRYFSTDIRIAFDCLRLY